MHINTSLLSSQPTLAIVGIEPEASYAGNVTAAIKGQDAYKIARLSVKVDGKPLVDNVKINRRSFEYPFTFQTKPLARGSIPWMLKWRMAGIQKKQHPPLPFT